MPRAAAGGRPRLGSHTPCLVLHAAAVARGRPEWAPLAVVRCVRGEALSLPRLLVFRAGSWVPLPVSPGGGRGGYRPHRARSCKLVWHPCGMQRPAGRVSQRASAGSPRLHNRTRSMWTEGTTACPKDRQREEGERLTPDAPHEGRRRPLPGRPRRVAGVCQGKAPLVVVRGDRG